MLNEADNERPVEKPRIRKYTRNPIRSSTLDRSRASIASSPGRSRLNSSFNPRSSLSPPKRVSTPATSSRMSHPTPDKKAGKYYE